jgi:hypothetical protein
MRRSSSSREAAAGVNAQVFSVRKNEIFDEPIALLRGSSRGLTPQACAEHMYPR